MIRRDQSAIVFRTLGWNLWTAAISLLFAFVGAASATRGDVAARVAYGVFASASCVVVIRALRAPVVVTDRALIVRGFARTHRLPWDDVAEVSGKITGAGRSVVITLTDGRTIAARGCASYRARRSRE